MDIRQVKVFGERNTGTNWVEKVISTGTNAKIVSHAGILKRNVTDADRAYIASFAPPLRVAAREKVNDHIFLTEAAALFGWKHGAVQHGRLAAEPGFSTTGFILLTKHPVWFLSSLHRRPYHALTEVPAEFSEFVATPWRTLARDYVREVELPSPALLWNHKVRSYLEFAERTENALVVRYEDILADYEAFLVKVREKFGLAEGGTAGKRVDASSKRDDLSFGDYQKKYLGAKPSETFDAATLGRIEAQLEGGVMAALGYRIN